jgi:CSLREA domain-containing protein
MCSVRSVLDLPQMLVLTSYQLPLARRDIVSSTRQHRSMAICCLIRSDPCHVSLRPHAAHAGDHRWSAVACRSCRINAVALASGEFVVTTAEDADGLTCPVSTSGDPANPSPTCSLRQAIRAANAAAGVSSSSTFRRRFLLLKRMVCTVRFAFGSETSIIRCQSLKEISPLTENPRRSTGPPRQI